ncbi:hypothetical protein HDV00_008539 [Rhizophlyctis rosea]|nr:hypothetical protein HDV00_008539 [Rhizophlyctis rosea]
MAPIIKGIYIPVDYSSDLKTAVLEQEVDLPPDTDGHYRHQILNILQCKVFETLAFSLTDQPDEIQFIIWDEDFKLDGKRINQFMKRELDLPVGGDILILGGKRLKTNTLLYEFSNAFIIDLATPQFSIGKVFCEAAKKAWNVGMEQRDRTYANIGPGELLLQHFWPEKAYEHFLLRKERHAIRYATLLAIDPSIVSFMPNSDKMETSPVECAFCNALDRRLHLCSGCKEFKYCSEKCQKEH